MHKERIFYVQVSGKNTNKIQNVLKTIRRNKP
jgi:hypothetical protein